MKIWAVIPCYNEKKLIREVVEEVKKYVDEVVVIDDGSTDHISEFIKDCGVNILRHLINRGQGASLCTGNDYALKNGADIVVHFDADGQHQAEEIRDLVKPLLENEADVVFGSRFLEKKAAIPWTKKWFIFKPAILFNNFFTGLKLTDVHNGFRALNKKALEMVKITQDRMAHNTEICSAVYKNNLQYKEVPVTIIYREYGQGFAGGLKILRDLFLDKILR